MTSFMSAMKNIVQTSATNNLHLIKEIIMNYIHDQLLSSGFNTHIIRGGAKRHPNIYQGTRERIVAVGESCIKFCEFYFSV